MLIPHIRSEQLKSEPDQVCMQLNRVIDIVNELGRKGLV